MGYVVVFALGLWIGWKWKERTFVNLLETLNKMSNEEIVQWAKSNEP